MRNRLIFILAVFTGLSTVTAQKSKVVTAWNYLKYEELDKAKAAIDEAAKGEGSKNMAKTWYYRGWIYHSIFQSKDSIMRKLDPDPLSVALESYNKSLEIEPKGEYTDDITLRKTVLLNQLFMRGVAEFNSQSFADAAKTFDLIFKTNPSDTAALYNLGYAAEKSGDLEKAKSAYQQLVEMQYDDPKLYFSLAYMYKNANDTAKAMEIIQKGRKRYPGDKALIIEELNAYLNSGNNTQAAENLILAISKDPENPNLHYNLGLIYDRIANPKDEKGKDISKPANYDELIAKAEASYKKAMEIKPDFFEAYYGLGGLYFNQGAEISNKANSIPSKEAQRYAKEEARFKEKFRQAQPLLEKALELNPKDVDTISSLKQLYARLGMMEKSAEMKKRLEQ